MMLLSRFGLGFLTLLSFPCALFGQQFRTTSGDSAGIRIVSNHHTSAPTQLRTADVPSVVIGGPSSGVELFRVLDAIALPNGRIAVLNAGSFEVMIFDGDGRLQAQAGARGDGPGEFQRLTRMGLHGDSLWVDDIGARRLSWFSVDGEFLGSRTVLGPQFVPQTVGVFRDGAALVSNGGTFAIAAEGPNRVEWLRDSLFVQRGTESRLSLVVAAQELTISHDYPSSRVPVTARSPREFGVRSPYGVWGDHIFMADGATGDIRSYDQAGTLRRIVRRPIERRRVSMNDIEALRSPRLERAQSENQRRQRQRFFDDLPDPPDYMPTLGGTLRFEPQGRLWMPLFHWPRDQPQTWAVLGTDGIWVADVEIPSGITVTDVGADYVIGVWRDDLDVERVVRYGLVPSAVNDPGDEPH